MFFKSQFLLMYKLKKKQISFAHAGVICTLSFTDFALYCLIFNPT